MHRAERKLLKRIFKAIGYTLLCVIGLAVVSYFSVTAYVNYQLERRTEHQAYNSCQKVWSARGVYAAWKDQNSIKSVRQALSMGAAGIEIDLHYDTVMRKFIISHDLPYNLKDGKLLSLKALLDAVGDRGYYWLDHKNMRWLSRAQSRDAIARLNEITTRGDLKSRIYVEGSDPLNLSLYRQAGFHTIFDVHPPKDSYPVTRFVIDLYKLFYYFGGHTVMGMAHGDMAEPIYGSDTQNSLGHVPLFLYHVPNNEVLIERLLAMPTVRVALVGRDASVDHFEKSGCTHPANAQLTPSN